MNEGKETGVNPTSNGRRFILESITLIIEVHQSKGKDPLR